MSIRENPWFILLLVATAFVAAAAIAQDTSPSAVRELLRLTNAERAQQGFAALENNELLARAAHVHARLMMREHKLSHQFSGEPNLQQRIGATHLRFQSSGENVAFFTDTHDAKKNAEQANDMLMHSPPHRANILGPDYNSIGIAMESDRREVWIVQDFAKAFPEVSEHDVEHQVESAVNETRAAHSLPQVRFSPQPKLHDYACRSDASPSSVLRSFPEAHSIDIFTTWQPRELSPGAMRRISQPTVRTISVAACAVEQAEAHGSFRVVLLFY